MHVAGFAVLLAAVCLAAAPPASGSPWVWDQDQDGIDDRLTEVAQNGILWAHEGLDPDGRLRFEVGLLNGLLQYGAYVRYLSPPTPADSTALVFLGADVVTVFQSVPYIRIRALYPSLVQIAALSGVDRVETLSLMYPVNWRAGRAMGVRQGKGSPYPSLEGDSNPTGDGKVVAVLDTGVNDAPLGFFPGHADLIGKVAGGASYATPGPAGYTPWHASVNPSQSSLGLNGFHGTHVAASIAGSSRGRFLGGIAPGAHLLDVKVLSDEGIGYGVAEGLEWCIRNRNRDWGGGVTGVDVVNLSLSGTDASDGSDCVCALADAAVQAGIVVVAAAGNRTDCGMISNPGAADGAITVGAYDPGDISDPGDDVLAAFSAFGPRADDGDGSHLDEMKPDLVAPGAAVISAWGSPLSSGHAYASAEGTSMSAALVSGVAALLLELDPDLTPPTLKAILHDTARHRQDGGLACGVLDPFGLDPRYHTGWGYGEVDAWAAAEELLHPDRTQFVALEATWDEAAQSVRVEWTTQREVDLTGFHLERAPDAGGEPGSFSPVTVSPVPAQGVMELSGENRTSYAVLDSAPPGEGWWYRVATTGGSVPEFSASLPAWSQLPDGVASFRFVHEVPETDLTFTLGSGLSQVTPQWVEAMSLVSSVDSFMLDTDPGASIRWDVSLSLYQAAAHLPPDPVHPWWLRAEEGGDPALSGSVEAFSISQGGATYPTDTPTPRPTLEGGVTSLWIPTPDAAGLPGDAGSGVPLLHVAPNPFRFGVVVSRIGTATSGKVQVHDLQGRIVRELTPGRDASGAWQVRWDGRDGRGRAVRAGTYFLRWDDGASVRLIRLP